VPEVMDNCTSEVQAIATLPIIDMSFPNVSHEDVPFYFLQIIKE
jgi:hypothetical protein